MSSVSNWTPIGNGTFSGTAVSGAAFKGTFYGKNHTIKGLKMVVPADAPAGTTCGLFGVISGATVKDVNIGEGSTLTSSSATMTCGGAVAGAAVNSTIDHCSSLASFDISGGADNVGQRFGGVAGSVYSAGEILAQVVNCTNFGASSPSTRPTARTAAPHSPSEESSASLNRHLPLCGRWSSLATTTVQ